MLKNNYETALNIEKPNHKKEFSFDNKYSFDNSKEEWIAP